MKTLLFLLFSIALARFDPCSAIFTQPEIEDVMNLAKKEGSSDLEECIAQLVRRDMWDMSLLLLDKAREHKVKLSGILKKEIDDMKRHLDKIVGAFEHNAARQVVSPAVKWAQSPEVLFLDVKYAHRFDAPGCMEVENRTVTIEPTLFKVEADCEQSGQLIHIQLEMDLFAEVDPDMSFYSDSSGGKLSVNLMKKEKGVWELPIKGIIKPTNLLVWWEMKEKYAQEMKAFEEEQRAKVPA